MRAGEGDAAKGPSPLAVALVPSLHRSEVGGSETNREIDFGFGSCVRARALVVRWDLGQILIAPLSLFPFLPAAFPFSLFPQRFCWQANHAVCNQHGAEYSKSRVLG